MTIGRIPSVEGGIQPTIMDAKGDLLAATAADTPARLAVGNNGETLLADSSTTTGLRWQADWNSGKNKIINGDFYINQRGFSSSTNGNNIYGFDRWMQISSGGTTTWTSQSFTPGTAPVAGYESRNFLQIASTGQSAAGDYSRIVQKIEDVRTFANQTITVSFWAKASSGTPSVATSLYQDFGTGGSPSAGVSPNGDKVAITTSWARYSFSFSVPSISGKTLGTNNDHNLWVNFWTSAGSTYNPNTNSLGIQTTTIQLWGVQVEAGSVATPFTTATGTIQGELAACQRYAYQIASGTTSPIGFGQATGTTTGTYTIYLPVVMRGNPALTVSSTASQFSMTNGSGSSSACSAVPALNILNNHIVTVNGTVASGLTAGQGSLLFANNTSATFLLSAEL